MARALAPLVSTPAVATPAPAPSNPANEEIQKGLFRQVALDTLVEICAITVITQICSRFAQTPEIKVSFIRNAVTVTGINFLARSVAAVSKYLNDKHAWMESVSSYLIAPACFAIKFHTSTTSCLIHELGHAAGWFLLAKDVQVQIIASDTHWATQPIFGPLSTASPLGEYLWKNLGGKSLFESILTGGGPFAHLITAQVALIFGSSIAKSYPKFAAYIIFSALISIVHELLYALISTSRSGTDYFKLWKVCGIHPLASVATIFALLIITSQICASLTSKKVESPAKTE